MSRQVADIQADLTAAYDARRAALKAESYNINSGQGSQAVTRNLVSINATISLLEQELDDVQSSDLAIVEIDVGRY